jgi:hypothetical protein
MPTAYLSPFQLKELTDVSVNPGSGQNNYSLTWNNANSRWEASNNIAGVTVRKGVGANTQAIGSTANGSGVNWIAQSENAGISNSLGNNWVAIGANSGISNSLGSDWQAIGINAGLLNSQGNYWVALGGGAAQNNTVGTAFFSLGVFSGFNNSTGSQFVNIGYDSGFFDDRSFYLNIANTRSKSLICGDFANNSVYFGHPGGAPAGVYSSATAGYGDAIASSATVPVPTAAVHAAASNTTRASLRIDSGVAPTTPNTGDIWVNSSNNSLNFQLPLINLQGTQVLATRRTGWAAPTGTATRTTFATFAGQDISATPTEAEVQAIDDHVKVLSERLKALIDDLTTHGLIGT